MADEILGSWSNLNEAVELGSLQGFGGAIEGASGVIQDQQPAITEPVCHQGVYGRSMGPESASTGFMPGIRRVMSLSDFSPVIVLNKSRLTPTTGKSLPSMDRRLPQAHRLDRWRARCPETLAHRSELHPNAEPRRIWNRPSLGLLECSLIQPGVRPGQPSFQADGVKPEQSVLIPPHELAPATAQLDRICTGGLPARDEFVLDQIQSAPTMPVPDITPLAPQLNVPLPSPAPLHS